TNYKFQITNSLSPVLVRGADRHEAAVGARDGAADQDEMIVGVDADDLEVADGHAFGSVAAGHAQALLGPAVAPGAGVRPGGAALPFALLDAVAGAQAAEVVPLHDASRAAPLGGAGHVDLLDVLEDLGGGQDGTDLDGRRRLQAELAQVALRLAVGFRRRRHP